MFFFFFSSRRRHTRFDCDWSSDVCSSDLSFVFNFFNQSRLQPAFFPDKSILCQPFLQFNLSHLLRNDGIFSNHMEWATIHHNQTPLWQMREQLLLEPLLENLVIERNASKVTLCL